MLVKKWDLGRVHATAAQLSHRFYFFKQISSNNRTGKRVGKGNQVRGPAVARVSIRARTWAESYKNKGLHHLRPSSVFLPPLLSPETANSGLASRNREGRDENSSRRADEERRTNLRVVPNQRWVHEQACLPACRHHEARLEEIVVVVCRRRQRW